VYSASEPWKGTAADLFVQAQFPIYSGRLLGLPVRILISAMGLVVAMLSVSGVVIWRRKRCAQAEASRLQRGARAMSPPLGFDLHRGPRLHLLQPRLHVRVRGHRRTDVDAVADHRIERKW